MIQHDRGQRQVTDKQPRANTDSHRMNVMYVQAQNLYYGGQIAHALWFSLTVGQEVESIELN